MTHGCFKMGLVLCRIASNASLFCIKPEPLLCPWCPCHMHAVSIIHDIILYKKKADGSQTFSQCCCLPSHFVGLWNHLSAPLSHFRFLHTCMREALVDHRNSSIDVKSIERMEWSSPYLFGLWIYSINHECGMIPRFKSMQWMVFYRCFPFVSWSLILYVEQTGGLSNRQKEHKKAMPLAAKRAKVTRSRQEKKKQQKRSGKQFRGKKAWKWCQVSSPIPPL